MKKLALLLASLALVVQLAGCSDQGSSAEPPANFKVTAGDASVVVTWTAEPDVDYWLFYGLGDSITTSNWTTTGGRVATKVTSPYFVGGLLNGRTYSFTINGRKDGGPGGPGAPTQVAVPRLSAVDWIAGSPLGTGKLNGVASGLTTAGIARVAVGAGGAIYTSIGSGAASPATNPAAPADLNSVFYSPRGIVAVGANGTLLASSDGTTWVSQASSTTAALYGGTSAGGSAYVAVGVGGAIVASPDGVTWVPVASNTASNLYATGYGAGRYVAVGAAGTLVTSTDTANWTVVAPVTPNDLRSVAFGAVEVSATETAPLWVAVGASGTLLTSSDGLAWTVQAPISANHFASVVYGGQFVAVGNAGSIYTSSDGTTWRSRASGTTVDLTAIARTQSGYYVVGDQGTNLTSD